MSEADNNKDGMQVNPQRAKQLVENLNHVAQRITAANTGGRKVRHDTRMC